MRSILAAVSVWLAFMPLAALAQTPPSPALYVNDSYDPRANPYRDLERAIERASAENKRILIVVGGDWCVWCEILDAFRDYDRARMLAFAWTWRRG
jgi:hypothetical protein